VALAQIIRGASSEEAARTFGVGLRTVDFHRANLLKKLGARSALISCIKFSANDAE
jgi:DNA-binding CsgD family transcriptional regulator